MKDIFIKQKRSFDNLTIAISTRHGGLSLGNFSSLNMALNVGDNKECVLKNRKLLFEVLNLDITKSVFANQYHSNNVYIVEQKDIGLGVDTFESAIKTDAFITNIKNVAIVIQTADCLSVVLYEKQKQVIANIHCGWKGLAFGIIQNTIEKMISIYNADSKNIYAYLGACIKPNNFNVGEDVASKFTSPIQKNDNYYIDLSLEAIMILEKYNITDIENSNLDSYDDMFYSYRRDKKITGRMATVIALHNL